jgi:hypothetical protein
LKENPQSPFTGEYATKCADTEAEKITLAMDNLNDILHRRFGGEPSGRKGNIP